jgi:hypothetical protein
MNQEDIIRMAREAGFEVYETDVWITDGWWLEELERFAGLVRADEREACAKVCEERQEVFQKYYTKGLAAMCAEAIRARSEL